ncbi:23S rRNA pseudouridine1911/1915/1917 synthase [Chitinophaga costaii]|uniref:Pseudouridine synthase n=1 Tax=Chitinophaga costaii TaxID=1335309 RepID=A0A1C3ZF01_9BACT|nr:RluA family pseudouridine synthase [Chitinophaga costaii]PUZ30341.1 RluA family pseudouridine synthase [Chitinophaga costaii]SCB80830.1 23S rRNA pseudouridine1911/1915/1917 synthase [Chitinophaga costaii]
MQDALYGPEDELENDADTLSEGESLYERLNFLVDKGQEPLRIDKFLQARIENATRSKVQQAIDAEMVLVNEKPVKSNYKIRPLDHILVLSNKNPEGHEVLPENIPLPIVYEDDDVLLVDKKPGMVVHPGSGNYTGTLVNGLAYYLNDDKTSPIPENARFGLVHRIDKNTSGLLVVAKSDKAMSDLAKQFADHTVQRRYLALVWGDFEEDEGTIVAHVGRHQRFRKIMDAYPDGEYGKEAITHYKVLERFNYVTLIECRLETGRTHQIRVHMQHIGHSLFNDDTYGGNRIVKGTVFAKYKQFVENCFEVMPRHALHARTLGFVHPRTRQFVHFESPIPDDFTQVVERWRRYIAARPLDAQ